MADEVIATLDLRVKTPPPTMKLFGPCSLKRNSLRRPPGLPEIDFVLRSGRAQLVGLGFICNSDEEAEAMRPVQGVHSSKAHAGSQTTGPEPQAPAIVCS
jgi:hypothetical protein